MIFNIMICKKIRLSASFPLLLEEVYIIISLLLMPDPVQSTLILLPSLLLFPRDVLQLSLLVLPQFLQFVLVALLVDVALGFYGLEDEVFLVGADTLKVRVG